MFQWLTNIFNFLVSLCQNNNNNIIENEFNYDFDNSYETDFDDFGTSISSPIGQHILKD